ncbi:MAG: hypothetical protein P8R42_05035 [Candidatus Binatia bacterium]|nr:hypothetical protein [Candidatus Binatia bacterium]
MSAATKPLQGSQALSSATHQRMFIALNIIGGVAVLASYVVGIATHPESSGAVWGGVPEGLQPLYTISMLLAAVGYFLFTGYILFSLDTSNVRIFGRFGFRAFSAIYAAILIPSALWMPLTFQMIETPNSALWLSIRIVLTVVGVASLALIASIATAAPSGARGARALAILGALLFSFQTAVLDALVWPAFFPVVAGG